MNIKQVEGPIFGRNSVTVGDRTFTLRWVEAFSWALKFAHLFWFVTFSPLLKYQERGHAADAGIANREQKWEIQLWGNYFPVENLVYGGNPKAESALFSFKGYDRQTFLPTHFLAEVGSMKRIWKEHYIDSI